MRDLKFSIFALLVFSSQAFSQDSLENCLEQQRERGIAVKVRDWDAIIRSADKTMKACRTTMSARQIFIISTDKLPALYYLRRYDEVLSESNRCITQYFDMPICHYWKSVVLFEKGKMPEALRASETGKRVSQAVISNGMDNLGRSSNEIDRINLEADIEAAKATLKNLEALTD